MSDLRNVSREFLTEFIELYQQFPCLWQVKSKDYSDRNKKNAAYEELVIKLKEVDKNATKDTVVKKINTIRGCFRKEHNKVLSSLKSGSGTDDVYHPTLWYYDLLLFVTEQDIPRTSTSNFSKTKFNRDEHNRSENEEDDREEGSVMSEGLGSPLGLAESATENSQTPSCSRNSSERPSSRSSSARPPRKRGQYNRNTTADEILTTIGRKLETGEQHSTDEFDAIGTNVACKLRRVSVTSARTRLFAEKLINDVLYYAELGYLNENSRFVLDQDAMDHPQLVRDISASAQAQLQCRLPPPNHTPGDEILAMTVPRPPTATEVNTSNIGTYIRSFMPNYDYTESG